MKCPFCIKVCTKCKRLLVAYKGNFYKHKTGKYGLLSKCKECDNKYNKQWHKDNSEHFKQYYKQWREDNPEYRKQYNKDNSEYIKEYNKQYYKDNKEHRKEYHKQWRENNPEYMKQYYKQWRENNPEYFKQHWDKYLEENGLERGEGSCGEQRVRQILTNINIEFSEQHRFDDCKFKYTLPFDFYIPSLNTIIEYDGIQHFETTGGWSDEEHLKETIIRDTVKNEYCKANGIRLIRIPYYEFHNIEQILSDLL